MTPVMSALFGVLAGLASLLAMMWVVLRVHKSMMGPEIPAARVDDPVPFEPWWVPRERFTALTLSDAFDPELCMLWGSQAEALELICDAADRGVPTRDVALIQRMVAARNPELYDGSGFEEWLNFLENCDLIRQKHDRVFITSAGAEFVSSCLRGKESKTRAA